MGSFPDKPPSPGPRPVVWAAKLEFLETLGNTLETALSPQAATPPPPGRVGLSRAEPIVSAPWASIPSVIRSVQSSRFFATPADVPDCGGTIGPLLTRRT